MVCVAGKVGGRLRMFGVYCIIAIVALCKRYCPGSVLVDVWCREGAAART
jgi:hypothetical protein